MTMTIMTRPAASWAPSPEIGWERAGRAVLAFLDAATTSFGRSTAYNARAEQQSAELAIHDAVLAIDRGLYALLLVLPGVTDRARQIGAKNLLGLRAEGDALLGPRDERRVLEQLVAELPAQRVFKLFQGLRVGDGAQGLRKANNARTRKLILRVVLGSPRIELWAVKYRTKVAEALVHAWGRKMTSVVRAILEKHPVERDAKDRSILGDLVDRFAPSEHVDRVRACVAFVLRAHVPPSLPLLVAYEAAKTDLAAGAKLPTEVLEGIRSVFHRDAPKETVLALTAATMTTGQKLAVQRRAAAADVDVRFDPHAHHAVRLYLYAFERGMTDAIVSALRRKAAKAGGALHLGFESIGVLVDGSGSMAGGKDQPLRPIATALAVRDVLVHAARATVVTTNGAHANAIGSLVRPSGDTGLAEGLLSLVEAGVEAVFVLSDGYENRPAGRFGEVVAALRAMGIGTPIFHLNPVFAAEAKGVRSLVAGDAIATLPVSGPDALGVALVRGLLVADPQRGIARLVEAARDLARRAETRSVLA